MILISFRATYVFYFLLGQLFHENISDLNAETSKLGGIGEPEPDQLLGDATDGGDQVGTPYTKTKTKLQRQKDKITKTNTKRPPPW